MEQMLTPDVVSETIDKQQLALAQMKTIRAQLTDELSTLGARLWINAHDDRLDTEEKDEWASWVAKLTWYMRIIDQIIDTAIVLTENNVKMQQIYFDHMANVDSDNSD